MWPKEKPPSRKKKKKSKPKSTTHDLVQVSRSCNRQGKGERLGCLCHMEIPPLPTLNHKSVKKQQWKGFRGGRVKSWGGSDWQTDRTREGGWGRETVWKSLLVWAAVVQRVNHEGQIGPVWYHRVARLHHLKTHVVERLDDGHWWEKRERSSSFYIFSSERPGLITRV